MQIQDKETVKTLCHQLIEAKPNLSVASSTSVIRKGEERMSEEAPLPLPPV